MGRRDAVQVVLEVVARMRALEPRLVVSYEPGWETRGNGTTPNYEGGIWHHTALASSAARPFPSQKLVKDGRVDLDGPLCNFAGPWCTVDAPRIHVVAAFPTNHAGASGGRSMGPLPVTKLFNPRVLGLEIDYAGTVPMAPGQEYVAHLWGRAVADVVGGGDINRVRAHMETSVTGKWDIGFALGKTYDMNAFRRAAAAVSPLGGALMALTDAEQAELLLAARQIRDLLGAAGAWNTKPEDSVKAWLAPIERYDYGADGKPKVGADGKPIVLKTPIRQELANLTAAVDSKTPSGPVISAPGQAVAIDYERIISGLADELDRRARDGDPKTGPTS